MPTEFAHRDDFDMDVITRIEEKCRAEFGHDFKIQFAGDMTPNDPLYHKVRAMAKVIINRSEFSTDYGFCLDCNNRMDEWPIIQIDWTSIKDDSNNVIGYKCPYCE